MDFVRIDASMLPEEEREDAEHVSIALATLQSNAEEFRQTVGLYLFAHERKQFLQQRMQLQWGRDMLDLIKIAGRNGAIVAQSFSRIMEAINKINAPVMWSRADMQKKREATKLFVSAFPTIAKIRLSAAHPGELTKSAAEQARHRTEGFNAGGVQVQGAAYVEGQMQGFKDRLEYFSTIEGKVAKYELSMAKADALDQVANLYCQAFYPLEGPTEARWRQQQTGNVALITQGQTQRPWWHSLVHI